MKPVYFLTIIIFIFHACEPKIVTLSALQAFIANEDNGLTKRIIKNNVETVLSYRPTDLIVAFNHKKDLIDKHAVDSIRKVYDKYLYFTLKLSNQGKELENSYLYSQTAFAEVVSYLASGMANDIQLVTLPQKDTINVLDYHYPRMYSTTGATTVMFAFDRSQLQNSQSFQVLHQSRELGLSVNTFHFSLNNIRKLPKIDFSSSNK